MDYLKYFGLRAEPFQNDADHRFYFEHAVQVKPRMRLVRAAQERKAFALLTGGPGIGKSALVQHLARTLDASEYSTHVIAVAHEACDSGWLIQHSARALGVANPAKALPNAVDELKAALTAEAAKGVHPILLVDDAQLLTDPTGIGDLACLSNLADDDGKPLASVILAGTPDLAERIAESVGLQQRLEVRVTLEAMDRQQANAYLAYRLQCVGATSEIFSEDAMELIFRYSNGLPRCVNTLAGNTLFESYMDESSWIDSEAVIRAAEGLGWVPADVETPMPASTPNIEVTEREEVVEDMEPEAVTIPTLSLFDDPNPIGDGEFELASILDELDPEDTAEPVEMDEPVESEEPIQAVPSEVPEPAEPPSESDEIDDLFDSIQLD